MIPGRREIQLETKHNKIYNKYNIAELQVFTGSILLFTLTPNGLWDQSHTISTFLLAELLSLRQLAKSDEETVRGRRGSEFSTVPGTLPLFFETA